MDLDEFRVILSNSRLDIWSFIDRAITVASLDYRQEFETRREGIVQRLYACRGCCGEAERRQPPVVSVARGVVVSGSREAKHEQYTPQLVMAHSERNDDCESRREKLGGLGRGYEDGKVKHEPYTPQLVPGDEDDVEIDVAVEEDEEEEEEEEDEEGEEGEGDPFVGLFDGEETRILTIKEQIEDPDQTEESLVELLQGLGDMDITFKGLKETDIGRHVNRLRKHPSNDVRRLVKQLVRKWKDLVDEWVKLNPPEIPSSTIIVDGESPPMNMRRNLQDSHSQVPDFAYSPIPHNGSSGSERNNSEPEVKPKSVPRGDLPVKPSYKPTVGSTSAPPPNRPHKETAIDLDRLASARRRLHENYQEAQNAKKQRTIQVMDIHEIPKPKNGYIVKNKGSFQGRHHR